MFGRNRRIVNCCAKNEEGRSALPHFMIRGCRSAGSAACLRPDGYCRAFRHLRNSSNRAFFSLSLIVAADEAPWRWAVKAVNCC